jgi:hypothetical protein
MMLIVEKLVEWRFVGETEVLGENLPQRHFVHYKSHMTRPEFEPGPPLSSFKTKVETFRQNFAKFQSIKFNLDNSVGIATGYRLDDRSSILERGKILFSSLQRPDRLWGPPSLLSNGYWERFPPE